MGIFTNFLSTILLPKQLVLTFNGKTYQILRTDKGFQDLYDASKEKNLGKIETLLKQYGYIKAALTAVAKEFNRLERENTPAPTSNEDDEEDDDVEQQAPEKATPKRAAATKTKKLDNLSISDNGQLLINGVTFDNKISKKIADLFYGGYDIMGYYKLLKKIAANPEAVVKSGLLDFLAANDLPITTDGNFLAYKVTKANGLDHHSGTIKYEVGKFVSMPRDQVDESRGVCSGRGLYFASIGYYSHHFSDDGRSARFLVEVDPADVVSIPTSYSNSKGRCCNMKVVKRIDWDISEVPTNAAIIDLSKWEVVKPTEETRKSNEELSERKMEVSGTQKLVSIPKAVTEALSAYVKRRHADLKDPTLKNAQKAIKIPGTSVGLIAEAAQKLGYLIVEGDVFSSSTISIKK